MVFCDTHIHLLAPEWSSPVDERIAAAQAARIGYLVQPGVRVTDWQALLALARRHPRVYAAPGVHPAYAGQWNSVSAACLRRLTEDPRVVAVGEIGLDAACGRDLGEQEAVLRAQLAVALEARLPVLLHGRRATGALLDILCQMKIGARVGGIWHGFSGSLEVARQLVEEGFLIGVGPVLLRANARKLPRVVSTLPATALVLETDAPDMASGPQVLLDVAQRIACLRGWTLNETARITTDNTLRLLQRMEKPIAGRDQ
ncbi:MAG: TatD family hydrolase [Pelovirga sp.]